MANHSLGTIRGTIEIDYDGAGIVRAVRDSDKAKKSFGTLKGASDTVLKAFASFMSGAAKVGGALSLLTNGVTVLSGAIAALGPVVAAGLAAAPAVILSFASALVIAKVAVSGVGDALKEAGEGGEKFEKALKKLSPEARKFALEFKAAYPQLKAIQRSIQDAFFTGAPAMVGQLVSRIAQLRGQASNVARSLGLIAQNIATTATSGSNIRQLNTILAGVNAFLIRIRASVGLVVTGFINLAAQGSKFAGTVGDQLANALATFAAFLNRIDLQAVFATALPILQAFGEFFKNIGIIVSEVFGMFTADGAGAVSILAQLAAQLAAFLQSAAGQAALQALGQAMQAISGAAGQIFLALLQALAPAIVALVPAIVTLAGQISGVLVPAINFLAPALQATAQFLSENMSWLGPVAGGVVALAAAYKTYAAAARAVVAVQTLLKSRIITATAAWARNTAAVVANRVAQIASAVVTGGQAVAAWAANTAATVANRIATMAVAVAQGVVKAATIAWTAVQWALNIALNANPIGIIILIIGALIAAVVLLWKNSETFRKVVLAAWEAIKVGAQALWNFLKAVFSGIWAAVKMYYTFIWNLTKTIWGAIVTAVKFYINAYKTIIMAVVNFVKTAWKNFLTGLKIVAQTVWNAIVNFIKARINQIKTIIAGIKVIISIVRNAFSQANATVRNLVNNIISTVRGIPGRVTSALGNLGRLLYNKGRDLIRGFINGIGSMIGAVRDKVSSVVGAVTRFLPGSPAKEGPLSGRGYVLYRARRFMTDFAQGIVDGSAKPRAALMGSVGGLGRATVPTSSTTKSGASATPMTTATATAGTREYNIAIGDKVFAKLVIDAVTGNPVAVKKAVDRGTQQTAWAGGR